MWDPFVHLETLDCVPERPTAAVVIQYNRYTQHVACGVRERSTTTPVARLGFSGLEVLQRTHIHEISSAPPIHRDSWCRPEVFLIDGSQATARQIICLSVLRNSDVFCPRQALVDLPAALRSPFWDYLLDEMERLHTVSVVMLD